MLLGAGGNLLWGEEVAYEEWSVKYPDVRLDSGKRVLSMLTATYACRSSSSNLRQSKPQPKQKSGSCDPLLH